MASKHKSSETAVLTSSSDVNQATRLALFIRANSTSGGRVLKQNQLGLSPTQESCGGSRDDNAERQKATTLHQL